MLVTVPETLGFIDVQLVFFKEKLLKFLKVGTLNTEPLVRGGTMVDVDSFETKKY